MRTVFLLILITGSLNAQVQPPDTARMKVSWNPNSELDLSGYKVYWGLTSRKYPNSLDAGNVLTKTIDGLKFNERYYVAVTAYDTADNESDFSQEVSIILESTQSDTLQGDYNNDGIVDFLDMIEFDRCFGSIQGGITWNSYFDFDKNGKIEFADLVVFDECFGDSVIK